MRTWSYWDDHLSLLLHRNSGWPFRVTFLPCAQFLSYNMLEDSHASEPKRNSSKLSLCSIPSLVRSLLFSLDCLGSSTCCCKKSVLDCWWLLEGPVASLYCWTQLLSLSQLPLSPLDPSPHRNIHADTTFQALPMPTHMVLSLKQPSSKCSDLSWYHQLFSFCHFCLSKKFL